MYWMIAANAKIYDCASAFQRWGFIDWRQRVNYSIGDTVYIYCTRPLKKVMYKATVIKEGMTSADIVNDEEYWCNKEEHLKSLGGKYARLLLKAQADREALSLESLVQHGLKSAPQGPIKISQELAQYIDSKLNDFDNDNMFPETDVPENCLEGATHQVLVNKYERSSIARQKCIEYYGTKCIICGFDFEKTYGEIGKNFIHIHHLVPLNTIKKEYVVDYKKDLIPVCPNCHAMLHRKLGDGYYTWQELKDKLNK